MIFLLSLLGLPHRPYGPSLLKFQFFDSHSILDITLDVATDVFIPWTTEKLQPHFGSHNYFIARENQAFI